MSGSGDVACIVADDPQCFLETGGVGCFSRRFPAARGRSYRIRHACRAIIGIPTMLGLAEGELPGGEGLVLIDEAVGLIIIAAEMAAFGIPKTYR